jgi:D-xylose 1-dehydrogenase
LVTIENCSTLLFYQIKIYIIYMTQAANQALRAVYPSLASKHVFITGGATGIGASIVAEFVNQGAHVSFVDIDDAAAAALIASLPLNAKVGYAHCDITNTVALQRAIASATLERGRLDVLVNNAANDLRHGYETVTPESWDQTLAINLKPQFFGIQEAAKHMKSGSSIITMGSVSWMRKTAGMVAYTASKSAINGLTRTMAQELGPQGIRVNCVVPGPIETPKQLALVVTPALHQQFLNEQALKFRLQSQDVAAMVLWLAADDSRACAGQSFIVDGGFV